MDIFDINTLFAQMVAALGGALVLGNGYALFMERRGVKPKGTDADLNKGRAWFLMAVGVVIAAWGLASLLTG